MDAKCQFLHESACIWKTRLRCSQGKKATRVAEAHMHQVLQVWAVVCDASQESALPSADVAFYTEGDIIAGGSVLHRPGPNL